MWIFKRKKAPHLHSYAHKKEALRDQLWKDTKLTDNSALNNVYYL